MGLAAIAVALAAPANAAEYYTWVDEDGITNFAEQNPAEYQAEHVSQSRRFGARAQEPSPNVPAATEQAPANASDAEVNPDQVIAAERAKYEAQLAEERSFNCNVCTQNLARLTTFARIRVKDENGEQRLMTDAEMTEKTNESRQLIRDNCSG